MASLTCLCSPTRHLTVLKAWKPPWAHSLLVQVIMPCLHSVHSQHNDCGRHTSCCQPAIMMLFFLFSSPSVHNPISWSMACFGALKVLPCLCQDERRVPSANFMCAWQIVQCLCMVCFTAWRSAVQGQHFCMKLRMQWWSAWAHVIFFYLSRRLLVHTCDVGVLC